MASDVTKKESKWQKLLDDYSPYIEDLWRRIYNMAIFFVIFFVVGFFGAGFCIKNLIKIFNLTNVTLVTTSPFQFLNLSVDIGLFVALICTIPFLMFNLYSFLRPAVSKKELRSLLGVLPTSFILFICGFAYGFFGLYLGLKVLARVSIIYGLQNYWDIGLFVSQLFITAMLLGVLFQFPIIMSIIIKLGIITRGFLKQKRRFAYAIITMVVAILPPTDGLSMLIMIIPFILMYEFVILFTKPAYKIQKSSKIEEISDF